MDITESRKKDFSQCSMQAGEAMTVIHSSDNSHSSNEPQAFAYNFPVTQPSPLNKNLPAVHPLSRLRGRTVTPKLHMDNVPHNYGSGPVRSVFLLFSGPRQPQLPTKARQLSFPRRHSISSTLQDFSFMQKDGNGRVQNVTNAILPGTDANAEHIMLPRNQLQERGKPIIPRKAQMTPEWESLAATLAPL